MPRDVCDGFDRRYAWDSNKGYGTPEHAAAIKKHGVCTHHRRSFSPIERALRLIETGVQLPLPDEIVEDA
jgi:ribonuclease HII